MIQHTTYNYTTNIKNVKFICRVSLIFVKLALVLHDEQLNGPSQVVHFSLQSPNIEL